jgi:hypothetical protein
MGDNKGGEINPVVTPDGKKSKKPLIITLIIMVGILLLVGIGFMIWYFAYFNSDNKVLSDAFYNTMKTTEGMNEMKMTAKIVDGDSTMPVDIEANIKTSYSKDTIAVDIDGKLSASIMSIGASANLVTNNNGEIYIKINDLRQLLANLGVTSDDLGSFDINKVSDKWIKISPDDLKDLMPQAEVDTGDYAKCIENVTTTLTEKKNVQKELLDAIKDSKVLAAKRVGSDKDGTKFKLTGDINAAEAFVDRLIDTEFFKAFKDCIEEFDADVTGVRQELTDDVDVVDPDLDWAEIISQVNQLRDQLNVEIHFWVGTWNHQPTRLLVSVKASEPNVEFVLDMTHKNGETDVKIPSDSTDLTSIIQGFNNPFNDLYNGVIDYDSI